MFGEGVAIEFGRRDVVRGRGVRGEEVVSDIDRAVKGDVLFSEAAKSEIGRSFVEFGNPMRMVSGIVFIHMWEISV